MTRLQLFKITLKFCKRWLFTVHLLSAVCSLGHEAWMGFLEVLPSALPSVPSLTGKHVWTHIQCSVKWSHFPLFLIFVALVSSGVMEGQSYAASSVITGSWHGASTAAEFCRGSRITAALYQEREKSLCSTPWTSGLLEWQILLEQDGDWLFLLMNAKVTQMIMTASKLYRYLDVYLKIPTRISIKFWIARGQLRTGDEAVSRSLFLKWSRQ